MGTQNHTDQLHLETAIPHWDPSLRVAFRFCFAYIGLFCLTSQIFGSLILIPNLFIPSPGTLWPLRQITSWTAAHIFRVGHPLVYISGSGDKTFDWVEAFCLLVIAILAMAIWSALDFKRRNYLTMHKWFRLLIRFGLAAVMVSYGMNKVIPIQLPFPFLTRLVEPFGNFTPMGVLWTSIGVSPTYEIFAGCAEMLGGILLIVPCTATLGALICLADLIQIFMVNLAYDIPAKLFSFHLILMALFLIAPDLPRLTSFFILNRPVSASSQPQLFRGRHANHIALVAQVVLGIWLVGVNIYGNWSDWYSFGGGRTKSQFYGIWNVDQLSIDGQSRSPLLTDYDRWRRVIFDFPTAGTFQRMDDSFVGYGATVSSDTKIISLTKASDRDWKAAFTFEHPVQDQLILDGNMDDHRISMRLHLVDRRNFTLVNSGFHWIAEYPFNRLEVRH